MDCKIDPKESEIIRDRTFVTLVAANKEGKPLGGAQSSILKTDKKFIWLHDLQVNPPCRDKGIGAQLVAKLAEIGKQQNADLIYAYPADPAGEKMPIPQSKIEHFYEKNGFVPCKAPERVVTVTNEGLATKGGVCLKL